MLAAGPQLREYQQRGVEIFAGLPEPRRFFFAWDMGAGKTLGALAVAKHFRRWNLLIVCPAIVRETWAREANAYLPWTVGVIRFGRHRKLSLKAHAERDAAFAADIQIVSYDLLGSVEAKGWDFIIVDEFHNLRSPSSKQSKYCRALFRANPEAWGLGLSGTPIPNEAQQLWNPVDTFFPGRWGKSTRPGNAPWAFVSRYCNKESNEFGTRFFGLKPERRGELAERFKTISFRVTQEEFAHLLPPLFVEALPVSGHPNPVQLAKEWLAEQNNVAHVGIYCHLKSTAEAIWKAVGQANLGVNTFLVTGNVDSKSRDLILETCRKSERSIIVGTTHALKEGISLSFQKASLIVEWVTEVAQVTQFIGRFARQDSTSQMPTRVQFVVGPNDVSRAEALSSRIAAIQSVLKSSRADEAAANVFSEREFTDDEFAAELERIIATQEKRAQLWSPDEDEEDDI